MPENAFPLINMKTPSMVSLDGARFIVNLFALLEESDRIYLGGDYMSNIIKKIKGLIYHGICKKQPTSTIHEEEKQLRDLYEGVQYDPNLFKVYVGEDKYIMGYMSATPDDNLDKAFFMYKTLYDTIVDLDGKIKKSFDLALRWEYSSDIDHFNMVSPPGAEEEEASAEE